MSYPMHSNGFAPAGQLSKFSPAQPLSKFNTHNLPYLQPLYYHICNHRRLQGTIFDCEFKGERVLSPQKWIDSQGAQMLWHKRRYPPANGKSRKRPWVPSAILREKVEETTNAETVSRPADTSKATSPTGSPPEKSSREGAHSGLNALDAYFNKLQGSAPSKQKMSPSRQSTQSGRENDVPVTRKAEPQSKNGDLSGVSNGLQSLEAYLEKLKGPKEKPRVQESDRPKVEEKTGESQPRLSEYQRKAILDKFTPALEDVALQDLFREVDLEIDDLDEVGDDSRSDSYMVYILAAINIAVYLFGLASPIETQEGTSTLPLLFGAKVNELIMDGQWWRLITPMFLHTGFLHVALSSWALLFFGPQVENVYGSLAFCMIYFLGGVCGNILSFFHTSAATVDGTAPFFALLSSWMMYLWFNRKALGEESADYGLKMTALLGTLMICLSCLLAIDEWTYLGAIFPGAIFGAIACPSVQVDSIDDETNPESSGVMYGTYDSPSHYVLTALFILFSALCLGGFYLLVPTLSEAFLTDISF